MAEASLPHSLDALPAPVRSAVVLRVVERLDFPLIAERLGCSELAARRRVRMGLALLRSSAPIR